MHYSVYFFQKEKKNKTTYKHACNLNVQKSLNKFISNFISMQKTIVGFIVEIHLA